MSEHFPAPVDLDLRLVQCFTVVAEYQHFGRAAEALHTTQPSLVSRSAASNSKWASACSTAPRAAPG